MLTSMSAVCAQEKLRDPTRPLGYAISVKPEQSLLLQAIFTGNGRKEAIINGVAVKEGSRIAGKKILRIGNNEVVYDDDNTPRVLKLRSSIFNK